MPLKMEDINAGDKLIADGGFTCIEQGRVCEVFANKDGRLAVKCCGPDDERSDYASNHTLDGQEEEDGTIVGFEKAPA